MSIPLSRWVVATIVLTSTFTSAQSYPNKPIRVVTSEPGGGADFAARLIAHGLADGMGQPVVVENRGGATIAPEIVAKAAPDAYTLVFQPNAMWILPLLRDDVPYDPIKDFSPIALTTTSPNILIVHPSVAANSVRELIAMAKANPGKLNYGSSGTGTSTHLAGELFKSMAGVNIVRIPYKGGGATMTALLSGEVQLTFSSAGAVAPHLKSGHLKALAVTSARPSALMPGVPTVAESGLPGYESGNISGVLAPAKTPAGLIARLNREIVSVLSDVDVRKAFFDSGVEVVGSTPEELAAVIRSDMARMGKVIKDAGIRAE